MSPILAQRPAHPYRYTLAFILCCLSLLLLAFCGYRLTIQHRYLQRGIAYDTLPPLPTAIDGLYGVNVSLEQYMSDEELSRVLELANAGGFRWLRQHFPWAEIEPEPGRYEWQPWDRVVTAVERHGLQLIAVLDTSPTWARRPIDRDNPSAPPQSPTTYSLFVRAFAQRYGEQLSCYEIWDQPNIEPNWGARAVDPGAYVRLLELAARELRAADPQGLVLLAGLAPNSEASGRNMGEVAFLRGVYQAGGRGLFDVVAAKPYGFWSGPEDRRVDPQVLNFSRLILLREEMVRHGDAHVPIWGVEFGWNSLPRGWQGRAAPWGTDDINKQADRTALAVRRAREEWAWLGVLCWADLQPAVPQDDPRWGFALLDSDLEPTVFYETLREAIAAPIRKVRADPTSYYLQVALIFAAVVLLLAVSVWLGVSLPWDVWARGFAAWYRGQPEWSQWTLLGGALAAYYLLPWALPSLLALGCAAVLICMRLDIGLAYQVFSIPFFLYPKHIFGKSFSMVETLTVLCVAAWLVRWLGQEILRSDLRSSLSGVRNWGSDWLRSWHSLDWAVAAFVCLAVLSLLVSANRGVSIREFRVIILEPVLLYFLLRESDLGDEQVLRLADALLLAGLAVCAVGLYQYLISGDVIVAEGVRRMRGVYASPNNLSLLLGRVIALALSVLWAGRPPRRLVYGLATFPLVLSLFLTYSRGGWLLSLPAGLLAIGVLRGRRAAWVALVAVALCVLLLVPLLGRQRILSLLDVDQGTTFYRLKLWQAAVAMIRDYPLTGVGLDNFLYRYPEYMLREAWQEPGLSHPHNIILDYWTRLGIGGVLILVWLLVAFFRLALRLYRRLPDGTVRAIIVGLIASMIAALAHGMIDNFYFLVDLAFVFFLSLGLVRSVAGSQSEGAYRRPRAS